MSRLDPVSMEAAQNIANQQREASIRLYVQNLELLYSHRMNHAFSNTRSYSNLIMFGGYAGFFTLLTIVKSETPYWAFYLGLILIATSLLFFVFNEIYNMFSAYYDVGELADRYFRLYDLRRSGMRPDELYNEANRLVFGTSEPLQNATLDDTEDAEKTRKVLPVWKVCFPISVIAGLMGGIVLIIGWSVELYRLYVPVS